MVQLTQYRGLANVTDFVEMFRHWNAGRSQVQISEALNIDRKAIRKYPAGESPILSPPVYRVGFV